MLNAHAYATACDTGFFCITFKLLWKDDMVRVVDCCLRTQHPRIEVRSRNQMTDIIYQSGIGTPASVQLYRAGRGLG